jgi:hypothetical protein
MTTKTTVSVVAMVGALALGVTGARAAEGAQRGQVSVAGAAGKVVVAGPVAFHAYSGFSGGTVYAARVVSGTDADCAQPLAGTDRPVEADKVLDFHVGAGQVACLETDTDRVLELLWHAQKDAPTPLTLARR